MSHLKIYLNWQHSYSIDGLCSFAIKGEVKIWKATKKTNIRQNNYIKTKSLEFDAKRSLFDKVNCSMDAQYNYILFSLCDG